MLYLCSLDFLFVLSSVFVLSSLCEENTVLNAKAHQAITNYPSIADFPEYNLLDDKENVAIGFSGGGSRAFTAAFGYLSALDQLGLMKKIRYIGGISGGSWATTTYTYAQNIKDEKAFLGPIVEPADIKLEDLKTMDPSCARGFSSAPLTKWAIESALNGTVDGLASGWVWSVFKTYFEPTGIIQNTRFSWNQDTVDEIKVRNPSLVEEPFLLPCNSARPFSVIGTILIGPTAALPYKPGTQNFTQIEITPLYVGQMKNLDVQYTGGIHQKKPISTHVGGVIEPYAYARKGATPASTQRLKANEKVGVLQVPEPETFLDLAYAAGASGWAPGAFFSTVKSKKLNENLGFLMDYWAPSSPTPSKEIGEPLHSNDGERLYEFGDGGSYENIPLINYMQRRVKKIVLFFMNSVALQPSSNWDVYKDPFSEDQISKSIPAFFGVTAPEGTQPSWENRSYELDRNQVFSQDDYPVLITALQAAQTEGRGIIATLNLTTVQNDWWGIPAGLTFEVTWSYLGRLSKWEDQLSPEMRDLAVPEGDAAADLSQTVQHGPFRSFPHYFTSGGDINYERANLLADLTGWSVLQHEDLFRSIVGA